MKDKLLFVLFNIGILLLILETSHAWMFWNINSSERALMYIAIFGVGLLFFQKQKKNRNRNNYFVLAVVFLFLANAMKTGASLLGMAQMLLYIMIMWFVMVSPLDVKKTILSFQTKFLALFLVFSFVAWVIHFIYPLPYTEIQILDFEHIPPTQNYYLFVISTSVFVDYRFHSVFIEPGHLGCILSFFIIANQFDFKNKYVLIMSIILVFTLSLAGYVIFFIGFLFYTIYKNKDSAILRKILAIGLVLLGIWIFGSRYNNGDNMLNELVVERLLYDEETGTIAGDNRYSDIMDRKFKQTITSTDVFFGIPVSQYKIFRENAGNGAGIKLWIIQKGIVGALLLFLGYFFIAKGSSNKRWAMFMLLVYVISSYQRMYFFWASYLIPFICGSTLPLLSRKNKFL